jgi:hypothetical protein
MLHNRTWAALVLALAATPGIASAQISTRRPSDGTGWS